MESKKPSKQEIKQKADLIREHLGNDWSSISDTQALLLCNDLTELASIFIGNYLNSIKKNMPEQ